MAILKLEMLKKILVDISFVLGLYTRLPMNYGPFSYENYGPHILRKPPLLGAPSIRSPFNYEKFGPQISWKPSPLGAPSIMKYNVYTLNS